MRLGSVVVVCMLISGCSGKILTSAAIDNDKPHEGVPFYEPKYVIEAYKFNRYADKNGSLLNVPCKPRWELVVKTMPDLSKVRYIKYEPGFLETSTFSVSLLENGLLKSVNTERELTIDAIEAFEKIISVPADPAFGKILSETGAEYHECNASKEFKGLFKTPTVGYYEDLVKAMGTDSGIRPPQF